MIGLMALCRTGKINSDISPIPPLIFIWVGVKSEKFGLDFRHHSPLKRSGFKTGQHIINLKFATAAQMISLNIDLEI